MTQATQVCVYEPRRRMQGAPGTTDRVKVRPMSRRLALAFASSCIACSVPAELPSAAIGQSKGELPSVDDPGEAHEDVETLELARSDGRLPGGAKGEKHLGWDLDRIAALQGLDARAGVPAWGVNAEGAELARDDDLLTSWACEPTSESPCAIGLSFPEPVELSVLRLYAAAGPGWKEYSSSPRLEKVRVHTDAGSAVATINDGAGHRYIELERPVRTASVTLEVVSTQGGNKGPIRVAELEALGTGPARAPLEFDPERVYVNYVNSDWKKNESGTHIVRQAFLEVQREGASPLRFMRATGLYGRRGDRFLLVERMYKTDCRYNGGSYVLIDTERRTYYPLGTLGGVPGEVFRHADGYGFAVGHGDLRDLRGAVFTGKDVETKEFPRNARDAASDYLDAWNMDTSPLPRGGVTMDEAPANCSPVEASERASLSGALAADGDEPMLHCNLESGAAIVASRGVAVVDESGQVLAEHPFEGRGEDPLRIVATGLGDHETRVELFIEARASTGANRVYRVHAAGVEPMAEDTALALRPPHTCKRADFGTAKMGPPPAESADASQADD